MRCSVLQCVAVCCSVLCELHRHVSACMTQLSVLECVAMYYSGLQCVAMCRSVLQRVVVCCSVLRELHRHVSAHIA